jgi:hypothetical protein
MQDNYVGDVGDFGKYGLLATVLACGGGEVRLGVNWYKFIAPENGDGRYTGYLDLENKNGRKYEEYERCFPEIYAALKGIVGARKREIPEIERSGVIGDGVVYYSEAVNGITSTGGEKDVKTPDQPPAQRRAAREAWFADSLAALEDANVIFLDPDNGIQPDPLQKSNKKAGKYFFRDECREYFAQGMSLILYHHRNRKPKKRYDADIRRLHRAIDGSATMFILRFRRYSVRDYIISAQPEHAELFGRVVRELTAPPYDFLFGEYRLDS